MSAHGLRRGQSSREPGLEKAVLIATGIVQPVAEALGRLTGATVLLDKAEAAYAGARDFAGGLDGWYWAIPVELTGVHNGAACVLVSQDLVQARDGDAAPDDEGAASFASILDEYLPRAVEKLASAWGGPVSLDRLGLRRTSAESAPEVLSEVLGPGGLVAVRFPARCRAPARRAAPGQDEGAGEALVVLGGRLAVDIAGWPDGRTDKRRARAELPGSAATQPVPGASAPETAKALTRDLIRRARALTVRVSADVGGRSMTLGELARLGPGSVIDLGKKVTDPLELRVYGAARLGRLVASGDAVTLPHGFGFRVRYLGVR